MADFRLKKLFAGANLHIEDFYLLESFQIEYFPGWLPESELASVLWTHPSIYRFLRTKSPATSRLLEAIKDRHPPAANRSDLARAEDVVVWTIADLIVYNKCPEVYDRLEFHNWDFAEVTSITPLDGKVIVDVGAGTGRVALESAMTAETKGEEEQHKRLIAPEWGYEFVRYREEDGWKRKYWKRLTPTGPRPPCRTRP